MAILSKFGTQTIKINIADNIQNGVAGVMGDFNSRALKVSIMAENGEVLEDPSIKIKLLCKTEKEELIFTEGEYLGEGIFQVNFANEVFEQEQELECIIQLSKEDEILYSRIFKRRVERGLLGTEREGTSTIIDLLKIMDFADNYEEKLKEMEVLGNKEEADIIRKAKAETDKFNRNAKNKTDVVNKIKTEVEGYKNTTVKAKDVTLVAKADFDKNYHRVTGILDAETDRERAEEERRKHDKEIQDLINGGLDNAGFVKLEDLKKTEDNLKSNIGGENILRGDGVNYFNSKWHDLSSQKKIALPGLEIDTLDLEEGDYLTVSFALHQKNWLINKPTFSINFRGDTTSWDTDTYRTLQITEEANEHKEYKATVKVTAKMKTNRKLNLVLLDFTNIKSGTVNICRMKVELGIRATPWTPNQTETRAKIEKLGNDLIDQSSENSKRFDRLETLMGNSNKINDNLILGTNGEWNEGREVTKLTDFSFATPFLKTFNRFTPTGDLTPVTVSYKVKFKNINPSKATLMFRLREVVGDTYGGWKEVKDSFSIKENEEYYFEHTLILPSNYFSDNNEFKYDFRLDGVASGIIYLKGIKLEYGEKATTWVPALADIEEASKINGEINARLENKIDKLLKLVGESNSNYKSILKSDKDLLGGVKHDR